VKVPCPAAQSLRGAQFFDRDLPSDQLILGQPHGAHATTAQLLGQPVPARHHPHTRTGIPISH
jgi:hypothetical protein